MPLEMCNGTSNIITAKTLVLLAFVCTFLAPATLKAQTLPGFQAPPTATLPFSGDNLALKGYAFYTIPSLTGFLPLDSSLLKKMPFPDSIGSIWIVFSLHNTSKTELPLVVNATGKMPLLYLYRQEGQRLVELGKTGYELPYSLQSIHGDQKRIPFQIPASASQLFYLRFMRYHDELGVSLPVLQKRGFALSEYQEEENKEASGRFIQFFLGGFFLAICVYSLLKFFSQSRDKVYLIYALVNFFCCFSITAYYNIPNLESSLFPWIKNNKEICSILSDLTIVLTFLFFMIILNIKTQSPVLYRITCGYIIFHIFVTIVLPLWAADPANIWLGRTSEILYPVCEILCLALDIMYTVYLGKRRTGFKRYLFYGACIMSTGMFLFTLSSILTTHEPFISKSGAIGEYIIMGFFIFSEVWFFIMALAQRERQTELDNARYQQELIAQLSAGKVLQENFTKSLELQVAERSERIVQQQQQLEQERRDKLLAILNRRISETELKALRSQMNPHFIFNSLNSIENFMMKNDKKMASDYFGKFASLIRIILDSSSSETVPFDKDMLALQLYVELEQLRFNHKFSYQVHTGKGLQDGNYNVPPLLIQPYVENAIVHGLAQSEKGELLLQVTADLDGDLILYTIEDNGIGRKQAMIYQHQNKKKHKSMGMEITRQRIELFNRQADAGGSIDIVDLYNEYQEATGTRVLVKLKVI